MVKERALGTMHAAEEPEGSFDVSFHERMRDWSEQLGNIQKNYGTTIEQLKAYVAERKPFIDRQKKIIGAIATEHGKGQLRNALKKIPDPSEKLDLSELHTNPGTEELLHDAEIYIHVPNELRLQIEGLAEVLTGKKYDEATKQALKSDALLEIPGRLESLEAYLRRTKQAFEAFNKGNESTAQV